MESPKKARKRSRKQAQRNQVSRVVQSGLHRPRRVQNDQPRSVDRGRRAPKPDPYPQSEYDYEENYIYTDGVYDDTYYDDYYGTDFEGPNRGDQSLVSPEGEMIVRITSKNRPGYYWAIDEGIEGYLMTEAEMFRVISPGLWGAGSISFESISRPGRYIRHRDGKIWIEEGDLSNEEFRRECSWFAKMDHFFSGFISFESVYQPGWFIRHNSRRLELTEIFSNQDRNDASFIMSDINSGMEVSVGSKKTENWKQYIGKTLEVESKAVPGHYCAYGQSGQAKLEVESHVFRMVDGLWGENTVSFESTNSPGFFLRSRGDRMWVEKADLRSEAVKQECSFNVWDDRFFAGYTSFESANNQDQWIRQKDRELTIDQVAGYQDTNDASFMLSEATPRPTTTTQIPTTTRRPRPRTTTRRPTTIQVFEARRPSYTEEVTYPCADYKPGDDDLQSFDFIRKFELDVNLDGYPGVARVRGSNKMQTAYRIDSTANLVMPTLRVFNQGLPEQFSFVTTFRNRRPTGGRWQLIRITNTAGQPQFAVGLNPARNTIEFSILNYNGELQTLSWEKAEVFDNEWHKLHFGVFRDKVVLYVNCEPVGEEPLQLVDSRIDLNGNIMIAKEANSQRTQAIDLQWMVMACDPESVERETCDELPPRAKPQQPQCEVTCPQGMPGRK